MAVAIALYALGVSLESRPHAGSSALVPVAIGFGSLATLIFAGDLVFLARRNIRQRRALRAPRVEYGTFDYEPEFLRANDLYLDAQNQITSAMSNSTEIFTKNIGLSSQAEADECADASRRLSKVYARLLPVMGENGEIARQCLRGFLRVSRPTTGGERDSLRGLLTSTRQARKSTRGYLRSIRDTRRSIRRLRKQNISRSLNESASELQSDLKDATKIVRETIRGLRVAERQMIRRLSWYWVRKPLPNQRFRKI